MPDEATTKYPDPDNDPTEENQTSEAEESPVFADPELAAEDNGDDSSAPSDSTALEDGDEEDGNGIADDSENTEDVEEEVEPPEEKEDLKRWYVVKVQSGREESIRAAIERRVKIEGLEEYFGQILIPMDKETVLSRGKRVVREKKKFPGYIMANVEFNDQILYLFRETSGVGDFVGGAPNQPPLPMSAKEVERIFGPVEPGPGPDIPPPSPFSIGDHVKVKDGVFSGMEGEVKEVLEDKGEIRIELVVLGRPVPVELEYWQVERV